MVVQCTWRASEGKDISNAVIWTCDEAKERTNIEEEVEAENCMLLVAPNTGSAEYLTVPACQLLLSCQPPDQITYLSILSEARVIELYGHHGEYIETIHNALLDEIDDMPVYRGDIKLNRPIQVCSIKFANLKTKEEMWLYGVKAITCKAKESLDNAMKIQYSEVERRLQEMGLELSEKAEAFKQLILCQQQNASILNVSDLTNIAQTLGLLKITQNKTPLLESKFGAATNFNVGSATTNILSQSHGESENNNNEKPLPVANMQSTKSEPIQSSSTQTDPVQELPFQIDFEDLKLFMNDKFEEMGRKMQEKMQKQLAEIEAKLLCKLDEVESFVKPQGVPAKP